MGKFNNLPEEMLLNILTRLPAETVLDCNLVCKPWRDVVRNPLFSQMHLNHLRSAANVGKLSFIFRCLDEEEQVEFYYGEYDENFHETPFSRITRLNSNLASDGHYVLGSCNGLICFRYNNYGPVYISNPITREYVKLRVQGDYCLWPGFGYVISTNEYKVVRISRTNCVAAVKVYTLGSGTGWRNLGETAETNWQTILPCAGAFANGALHWVDKKGTIVLAFHLADEKFSELPAPPPYLTGDAVPYLDVRLGVLGDFLSAYYYNRDSGDFDIWLWKKNKDNNDFSWVKELNLVLSGSQIPRPLGFTKSGRLLFDYDRKIYSYDPKASSAIMNVSFREFMYQAIPHKNTLVSLKVLGQKDTIIIEPGEKDAKTMESGEKILGAKTIGSGKRASSSEETENCDKLKKPQYKVRDWVVGFYDISMKKFILGIQKLHFSRTSEERLEHTRSTSLGST